MIILYFLVGAFIIAIDQITKMKIASEYFIGATKPIIDGILSFTYVQNRGAAFGMLENARSFFIIATIIVLVGAAIYFIKERPKNKLEIWSITLILSGAIGNFIDRTILGYVRDFIEVKFIDFPVFNIADCAVTIGAVLLILYYLLDKGESAKHEENKS